jgi:hypothetical protein
MYKVLSAESCSGGDTQQPAAVVASQAACNQPIKNLPHLPSGSLLYTVVNKGVKQQFLGRGMTL